MKAAFPKKSQEILGTDELVIIIVQSDDVSLKIGLLDENGFARNIRQAHTKALFTPRIKLGMDSRNEVGLYLSLR